MQEKQAPLGLLENDLAFYRDKPFREYRPRFGIEQQDEKTIWLTDHGRRVALVDKRDYQIDLFEFQPGQPQLANPQKPMYYHAPTLLGARLTLAQWIGAQGRTSDTWDLAIEESPEKIVLTVTETWQKRAIHSTKRVELRVHPQFGYVLYTSDTMRSAEPFVVELYNFMHQGLTHHHPAKRRYPLVVWHSPSRGLLKWTSNLASLRCAGHQEREAARNLGANGWLGFFGEPDWNPIFALSEASQPCMLSTCDNLLDEHFHFAPAAALSMRGTLLALPGALAKPLIERAAFNDLLADPFNSRLRPFCLNQLSDFETPVALEAYFRGQYWPVPENGNDWATISDEKSHAGRWALRLRVRPSDGEKSIRPTGSSMWLDAGRTYRLSAFVCYEGRGPASLRVQASQGYYSWSEGRELKEARLDATASTTWQRLELTFRALPDDPAGIIELLASGDGKWFVDDMLLEEIN